MRLLCNIAATGLLLAAATAAPAAVTDPAGDFLGTYTGPTIGQVDILSGDVTFDGTAFTLSATLAGDVVPTPGLLYAWGINRGAGTPRIDLLRDPDIAGDILFDAVIVMLPNGMLSVVTIPTAGAPTFTNIIGGTTVSGDTLSATIPLSSLFSTGFGPEDYTFGFWSRVRVDPTVDGTNNEIADFLLGSGSINARVVPEPGTWMTMLLGFGVIGSVIRRTRAQQVLRTLHA